MKRLLLIAFFAFMASFAFAQKGIVKGVLIDKDTKEPLIGANVVEKATSIGTITDIDGLFQLELDAGEVTLIFSYVGYASYEEKISVISGETLELGNVILSSDVIGLSEIMVLADVAIDRKTPVAVSTIKSADIQTKVGNQEFPEILRYTPSIYVTKQGGGFGDSRINVRGFNQSNTAIMINGVPVNDMENGWVYWSNWAGLTDIASNVQVQRGLGASKLAVSSVGGTINIITNAAEMQKGGRFSVDVGNDAYQKYNLMLSTGLGKGGWAFTLQGSHTRGNGYVDGTNFRAGSYFASIAWVVNDKHTLNVTGLGAPQWHHQRTNDIQFYDFPNGVTIEAFNNHPRGIKYNPMWGELDGEEYSWRRNFYHKPKVYLNWYWNPSQKTSVSTTVYGSWGRGGGTGDRGRINGLRATANEMLDQRYGADHLGQTRFEDIRTWNSGGSVPDFGADKQVWYQHNTDSIDNRRGFFGDKYVSTSGYGMIRRASINSHDWYGLISSMNRTIDDNWNYTVGIDLRTYTGIHYRRMNDLLGSDAYFTNRNVNIAGNFITQQKEAKGLVTLENDQKLNYHNDGLVGWYGAFGQMEYSKNRLSAFLSGAISNQSYQRVDYFNYYYEDELNRDAGLDENLRSEKVVRTGGNVKAGLNYNFTDKHNGFFNIGYYSRQPLFDAVFLNFVNEVNQELKNEKVFGTELGYGLRTRFWTVNLNLYYTTWRDRFDDDEIRLEDGQEGTANLYGITQRHMGAEVDFSGEITRGLVLDGMFSIGDWEYQDNVNLTVFDENRDPIGERTLYLKNVKVGDAAQTTMRAALTWEIVKGLKIYGSYYYADRLFAQFNITEDKFFDPNNDGVLELPAYSLVDFGLFYNFKVGDSDWTFKANVNNALNEKYFSESLTNITEPERFTENVAFPGFGTTWNSGLTIRF